jgi:acyl-CoA synthetase (AMP-forming)/AMP-acid ligase II
MMLYRAFDDAATAGRDESSDREAIENPPPGPPFAATAPNLFRFARETHGDREFLVLDDLRLSFSEADRCSAHLAKGLIALGVGKGTRVGLLMPNAPDWVLAWMACARIGALCVTLSTFFQPGEIAWALRHNDVQLLLTARHFLKNDYAEKLERALPGLANAISTEIYHRAAPHLRKIVLWGKSDRRWALNGPDALLEAAAANPAIHDALLAGIEESVTPGDAMLIICTSGTTSEPKAVVHSHGTAIRAPYQFLDYYDIQPWDRAYPGMPFFWVGGINSHLIPALHTGSCLCFARSPDPADVIAMARRESVTVMLQWPPQARRLQQLLDETGQSLPLVRVGLGPWVDRHGQIIPDDRRPGGSLGMTESFGMHSMDRIDTPMPAGKAGANGRKLLGMDRIVVDPRTGEQLPKGRPGELFIRGNNMMLGYYGKERWETFTRDGYFPTGDLVIVDEEEFVWFLGRRGEMIKTVGANVAPPEVENALATCEGVREAIVFGIPDVTKGEAVIAVVTSMEGFEFDAAAIRGALRELISPYKVPQTIVRMAHEDIPRTASGKPIKHKLREMLFPGDDTAPVVDNTARS